MKVVIIFLLVLLNAGIFVYVQFSQPSPQQALPELNPEKIKILNEQELEALSNPADEVPTDLSR